MRRCNLSTAENYKDRCTKLRPFSTSTEASNINRRFDYTRRDLPSQSINRNSFMKTDKNSPMHFTHQNFMSKKSDARNSRDARTSKQGMSFGGEAASTKKFTINDLNE